MKTNTISNSFRAFLLAVSIFPLVLVSCRTAEQKYADEYVRFAESFLSQCDSYTATDWDAAAIRYEQLKEEYPSFVTDLTAEQRQTIEQYNSKINAAFIKHEVSSATDTFKSLINEAVGTLNELLE